MENLKNYLASNNIYCDSRNESKVYEIGDNEQEHSKFIANLLNPKGTYGEGDKFLKAFLKQAGISEDYIDAAKCNPNIVERDIGPINEDETEGGRIDIIIEDKTHAVIIENKIYAADQNHQLLRYSNYAIKKRFDYKIIYLTLFGDMPAEDFSDKDNLIYMSYEKDILEWLAECVKIAPDRIIQNEKIIPYINLIKKLTQQTMKDKDLKQVAEIAIEEENVDNMITIMKAIPQISKLLMERYLYPELEKFAHDNGFDYKRDSKTIRFSKLGWKGGIQVLFYKVKDKWNGLYIGITDGEKHTINKASKLNCLSKEPQDNYPYGIDCFCVSGKTFLGDCDPFNAFNSIKNGDIANWVEKKIKEILTEIEEKKIPM